MAELTIGQKLEILSSFLAEERQWRGSVNPDVSYHERLFGMAQKDDQFCHDLFHRVQRDNGFFNV